jgi:hypothetical protein
LADFDACGSTIFSVGSSDGWFTGCVAALAFALGFICACAIAKPAIAKARAQ